MSGTRYLPPPNPEDGSAENRERYKAYVLRANFVNFTGHTKEGMVGMAFRKKPELSLPETIEYLESNVNGDGLSFQQLAQDVVGDILETGRYGILVDYPFAESGLTQAEVRNLQLRASFKQYLAESIINWRCETIGGVNKLTMAVLAEPTEIQEDEFSSKEVMYHRVLLLKEGVYVQNLYDDEDNLVVYGEEKEADIIPRKSDGSTWDEIPFMFMGSENNDKTVDKSPLYDIAEINVAHYRNSADYEESSFMVGQPTPVISGLTQSWVEANFEEGVFLGSRRSIPLPEGGSADLLQANANQMPERGMEQKEQQMVMIGARIIQDNTGDETAEAAKIRFAGQNSKLGTIVGNVKDGMLVCLGWAIEFMGGSTEVELEFNTQFYEASIDPQLLMAQINLMDRAVLAKKDVRRNLRRANMIDPDREDDDIDAEATNINPLE